MCRRKLGLGLVVIAAGCARVWSPSPPPLEDDPSIALPSFFDQPASEVNSGGVFALEGVVLRAIQIAADDFLPPDRAKQACWDRQDAHRYQVIRRERIIFVRIDEDLEACGLRYVSLDTGVTYAISEEGRILRRVFDTPAAVPTQASPVQADAGQMPARDASTMPIETADAGAQDAGAASPGDGGTRP